MRYLIVCKLTISLVLIPFLCGCQAFKQDAQPRYGAEKSGLFGLRRQGQRNFDPDEVLDPMGARRADRLVVSDFSPTNINNTIQTRLFNNKNPDEAQSVFKDAQALYAQATEKMESDPQGDSHVEDFVNAAKLYRIAASRWPDSTIEEDSLFFEGQSFFFANHYVESNRAYEKLISLFSGTRYLDKAEQHRFAIARYWLEKAEQYRGLAINDPERPRMNLVSEARRIFHRIRIDDPTGKFADDATNALADAYFSDERYAEAADTYEDLRRNYPGSRFQYHAHLFELKSRLLSYQGPSYDDQPLLKADDLMRSIVQQFPEEARKEKDFLAKEATKIQQKLAERGLATAKYYENRGENLAAKLMYEQVAENYSHTKLAQTLEQQIADVSSKPPVPPERGKWLVNLFPDREEQKPVLTAGNEKLFR